MGGGLKFVGSVNIKLYDFELHYEKKTKALKTLPYFENVISNFYLSKRQVDESLVNTVNDNCNLARLGID